MRGSEKDRRRNFAKKVSVGLPIEYIGAMKDIVDLMMSAFQSGLEEYDARCPLCGNSHEVEIICHHCGHGEEKYE